MRNCLNCKWHTTGEVSGGGTRKYCACRYAADLKYPKLHIFCKQWNNEEFKFLGKHAYLLNQMLDIDMEAESK